MSLIAIVVFAGVSFAQAPSGPPAVEQVPSAPVSVVPGRTSTATLTFRIGPGSHINSHKPMSELLLPTELKLSPPTEIMLAKVDYPEGQMLSLPFSPGEKLSVYSGDFTVKALVRAAQNAPAGRFRIHGELKYQACNDRQCFPPKKIPIYFDVNVSKAHRRR